ncbi:MAG TPA: A24 family peptidase [Pirellulaceae bacterium]|nr:A24 family peptidase [Pirellulaceae bacterium]
MPTSLEFPLLIGLFTLAAALTDLRMRRVPNYLTVPAALLGLAYHTLAPQGQGVLFALAGFAVGFALLILPWILGGGGMGDVKLLAALGTWLGPGLILVAFGGSAIIAAFMALAVIIGNTMQHGIAASKSRYIAAGHSGDVTVERGEALIQAKKRRVVPFAVPVAVSTWLVLAWILLRSL